MSKSSLSFFSMRWDLYIDDQPLARIGFRHPVSTILIQGSMVNYHQQFKLPDDRSPADYYLVELSRMMLVSRYWMRAEVRLSTADGQPMCMPFWWAGHISDPDGFPQLRETPSSVDLILPGAPQPSKTGDWKDWRYGPITMLTYVYGKVEYE